MLLAIAVQQKNALDRNMIEDAARDLCDYEMANLEIAEIMTKTYPPSMLDALRDDTPSHPRRGLLRESVIAATRFPTSAEGIVDVLGGAATGDHAKDLKRVLNTLSKLKKQGRVVQVGELWSRPERRSFWRRVMARVY
jgi:hypothetical protein